MSMGMRCLLLDALMVYGFPINLLKIENIRQQGVVISEDELLVVFVYLYLYRIVLLNFELSDISFNEDVAYKIKWIYVLMMCYITIYLFKALTYL